MIRYDCPICGRTTCNSNNVVAPCPPCASNPNAKRNINIIDAIRLIAFVGVLIVAAVILLK